MNELWQNIYHGNDIDYIEIEATIEAGEKKKKKNYLYRIMMKKRINNFDGPREKI
jgi:hypothetical protein